MTTLVYNSSNLSVKDRLTISNLLGLFQSRLTEKWAPSGQKQDPAANVILIDMDSAAAVQAWDNARPQEARVAVTVNDPSPHQPFVSRPIRAFGPNGVVVVFNSIAQALSSSAARAGEAESRREPPYIRMSGRLEAAAAPSRASLTPRPAPTPAWSVSTPVSPAQQPPVPRPAPPAFRLGAQATFTQIPNLGPASGQSNRQPAAQAAESSVPPSAERLPASTVAPPETLRVRVAVRWGPPEPVSLPPLTRMPGARVHVLWDNSGAQEQARSSPAAFAPDAPPHLSETAGVTASSLPAPAKNWTIPAQDPPTQVTQMPIAHRPVEIHAPSVPVVGRTHLESQFRTDPPNPEDFSDVPFLRPSPPLWRAPKEDPIEKLVDFRSIPVPMVAPEQVEETAGETAAESQTSGDASALPAEAGAADTAAGEIAAEPGHEENIPEQNVPEDAEVVFAEIQQTLENLSHAVADDAFAGESAESDAEFDWWGGVEDGDESAAEAAANPNDDSDLVRALKAIKASGQPSILEIAGLPAVCVIPARNIYFTSAPTARIEAAIGAQADATWRACASESEARQLTGTEQSRQASLEQLSWTACLLTPPANPDGMADDAVRLRRWPPITESRGRSRYLRYATLLSGSHATPRELADITGEPLEEIVRFVHACAQMQLLDKSAQPRAVLPAAMQGAAEASSGAGILRGMIEQLTPPKL